jgi:NAD(P)-dependent dehydrogenase (short-subunit alcohol dehydrogenase family)
MAIIEKLFSLEGKVALVTGASKGLGRSMASALAEAGADLVLAARNMPLLEEFANVLNAYGRKVVPVKCDVGNHDEVQKMMSAAIHEMKRIDILVNNAGVAINKSFKDLDFDDWEGQIKVNLSSAFLTCKAVAPHMVKNRDGKIINIASVLGIRATWNSLGYCTTKAALIQFTRTLAFEWARYNIKVNCIAPGYFRTDMTQTLEDFPETKRMILEHIPFNRMGDPQELSGAVIFLASKASDYMTGQTIFVDGGYLTW